MDKREAARLKSNFLHVLIEAMDADVEGMELPKIVVHPDDFTGYERGVIETLCDGYVGGYHDTPGEYRFNDEIRHLPIAAGSHIDAQQRPDEPSAPDSEAVDHPAHYGGESNPYEAIKVIEAAQPGSIDFHLGNALKYLLRAGKKGDLIEDLRKARWYVDRAIGVKGAK